MTLFLNLRIPLFPPPVPSCGKDKMSLDMPLHVEEGAPSFVCWISCFSRLAELISNDIIVQVQSHGSPLPFHQAAQPSLVSVSTASTRLNILCKGRQGGIWHLLNSWVTLCCLIDLPQSIITFSLLWAGILASHVGPFSLLQRQEPWRTFSSVSLDIFFKKWLKYVEPSILNVDGLGGQEHPQPFQRFGFQLWHGDPQLPVTLWSDGCRLLFVDRAPKLRRANTYTHYRNIS